MNPGTHPRLLFFLLLLAGFATTSYSSSYPANRPGTVCELSITNVTTTNETCPGANDGTLTVEATCPSCTGGNADIRYSIDNLDFSNTTGVFTGLAPGSYTVYVRDVNEVDCLDSDGPHTVVSGLDTEAPLPDAGSDWIETSKALASDGTLLDNFGISVSISGDYAIVGSYLDDDNGSSSGSAYIFHRSGNSWSQQAKLTASDGAANDQFGISISISGDYAIVGAYLDDDDGSNSGSAYIFHRNGSTWTQQAKLIAEDAAAFDNFGYSVSISGDYAIIGAHLDDDHGSESGSAYIFQRNGSSWTQQAKLTASDGAAFDFFGFSVSISGDYAIVGAYLDDDNGSDSGSAYIFQRNGSSWTQQAKLTADDAATNDEFGNSVSVSGDYAIVGAYSDDNLGSNSGSTYIFQRIGSTWTQVSKLTASDGAEGAQFGKSVSISGDYAIVGASGDNDNGTNSGSAYIFQRSGSNWVEQAKLTASDGASGDLYGHSVSISGNYVIVGAHRDNDNGPFSGSAYFLKRAPGELPIFTDECSATPPTPTATDICAGTISGTTTTSFPITTPGTTTITWTYDDGNGNIAIQEQDIVILGDVTAPIAICPTVAPTLVLDGSGMGTLAANALAGGNSMDNCSVTLLENSPVTNFTCADAPSATVLLTATDEAGNTNSTNCTVNIDDSNCPCIIILDVTTTDETCPGSNDGTLTVTAFCGTCANGNTDIRYSIDSIDFSNITGVFTELASGTYPVYVRDVNDADCTNSTDFTIAPGVDSEPPVPDVSTGVYWAEVGKALASDGMADDQFGFSVSISGDYAIIGAHHDDDNGAYSGSAYIFHRSGSTWTQQAKLTADDGAYGDRFGSSVSICGDYAVVGAYFDDENGFSSGSAYIFHRNDSTWTQQAKLVASDGALVDHFGYSVSISGDYVIVGARLDDDNASNSGSAYIFHRNDSTWVQQAKLTALDASEDDEFGWAVSISGDYAIVGAYRANVIGLNSGAAYIFQRNDSIWTQQVKLVTDDAEAFDYFGYSVSMDGDYAVVGAYRDSKIGFESGAAYVFQRNGTTWTQQAKLTAVQGPLLSLYGHSVAISGEYAIEGSRWAYNNFVKSGSAYVYKRSGDLWDQESKLTASDGVAHDEFGYSVSISGEYLIVGAYADDDNGTDSGSAYFFKRTLGDLPDIYAECSATPPTPTATDNCAGTIYGTTTTTFPITTPGTTTVIWNFDDGNGNITTQKQDIVLEDVTAPLAICPSVAPTVVLDGNGNGSLPANALVGGNSTDNCDAAPLETSPMMNFTCVDAPTAILVLKAIDAAGNIDSTNCTVIIDYSNCPCIIITDVVATDETCPGVNDGTLMATATCISCAGNNADIRYSIDNDDFSNTTGVFTGLTPGSYTVYVRDINDINCTNSDGLHTVVANTDNELPWPDVTNAAGWAEAAKVLANDGSTGDQFGRSVSISGDYAIVGAHRDSDNGYSSGSAYIFKRTGSNWTQQTKLTASDAAEEDWFGYSVSISGDYAIVGAFMDDDNGSSSGAAYVFERSGNNWTQQAKLTASDGAAGDEFGNSVSISGDYAIVAAYGDEENGFGSGSAYIFERTGNSWTQQAKVTPPDGEANDRFGISVSISGDYAIVGAFWDDSNGFFSGSAYMYQRSGSTWTQQTKLTASDGEANDEFGVSVSISDDYAIVGAHRDNDNGTFSGSAYIFQRNGNNWTQQAKLTAPDGAADDRFGISVSISGDNVIVGTPLDDDNGSNSGSAYVYARTGNSWLQQTKLTASDGATDDWFGRFVSISGDYAIVGGHLSDDNGSDSGSAYFLWLAPGNLPPFTAECSATPPTPTATDNCTGTIIGTTTTSFPITTPGTTTITWTYDDGYGNITTQEQEIVLEDVTEPVITCPTDIAVQATSQAGAVVTFADAMATDNCDVPTVTQTQGAASGSTFAAGLHTIVFEATDIASNTASCSFTIEVEPLVSVFNVGANGPIKLYQNIPNPFDEVTRIGFELPEATEVKLRITDVSGREIQLIEGRYAAGYHEVEVRNLPARGLFFYQLQTEGFTATLKMVRE